MTAAFMKPSSEAGCFTYITQLHGHHTAYGEQC